VAAKNAAGHFESESCQVFHMVRSCMRRALMMTITARLHILVAKEFWNLSVFHTVMDRSILAFCRSLWLVTWICSTLWLLRNKPQRLIVPSPNCVRLRSD